MTEDKNCYLTLSVPQASRDIPSFLEVDRKNDWVLYGKDNKFPQYLYDLYLRSAVLSSIVNGTVDFILGEGLLVNDKIKSFEDNMNKNGDTFEDIVKRITCDYMIFGGFALQIIRNKANEIGEIYWIDFQKLRRNKDKNTIYYCEDWSKKNNVIEYEAYDEAKRQANSIFYFEGHLSRGTYPVCKYIGSLPAIETSCEIAKFHLNSILNNFNVSAVVNFNNGVPSEDIQEEIERKLNAKFSGSDNASKMLISFNDSKDNAVSIERLASDDFDKRYETLSKDTMKMIFVAFRTQPQLFGYVIEGSLFNKDEFDEAYRLYFKSTLRPCRNDIIRVFNKIFNIEGDTIGFIDNNTLETKEEE